MSPSATGRRRLLPGSPFNTPEVAVARQHYEVDDRVSHDRHGLGRVVSIDALGTVVVDFGSDVRRVALPSSKLTKL